MSGAIDKISAWFGSTAGWIVNRRWKLVLGLVLLNGLAAAGVSLVEENTSPDDWMTDDEAQVRDGQRYREVFGNNDYVVILVSADDVFSHDTLSMMRGLGDRLLEEVPYAHRVTSLAHLELIRPSKEGIAVTELVPPEIPGDADALAEIRRQAMSSRHLVGRLFSRDYRKATILLEMERYPSSDAKSITSCQYEVAQTVHDLLETEPYAGRDLLAAGLPITTYERNTWNLRESLRILGIALFVMFVFLLVTTRSPVGVLAPLLTILSTVLVTFGGMGVMCISVESLVKIVPVLVLLVVSVGYIVHLLAFFRRGMRLGQRRLEAIAYALDQTGWPLLFTAVTTVIGFVSFAVVPIRPVRWLGLTSAVMVALAFPLSLLWTSLLLSFGSDGVPKRASRKSSGGWVETQLDHLGTWVLRHSVSILVLSALTSAVFAFFMTRVEVDTDLLKTTGLDVPFVRKSFTVARSIGSLYAYDATIDLGRKDAARDPVVLKNLDRLARELSDNAIVKRTSSLADVVSELNLAFHGSDPAFERLPDDRKGVAQLLLLYEMSGGARTEQWVDYEDRILRLRVELRDYSSRAVEQQFETFKNRGSELFPGAKLGLVGTPVLYGRMVNYLVEGQIKSVLIALVCIAIVMMVVFGSVRLGLIGMVPNIAPVLFVVGTMGLSGIPLHILTMVIAPMVMGLAVDDTIHYMSHIRREVLRLRSYTAATRATFRTVGKALLLTTSVICLGFGVFVTSNANHFVHLGVLTIVAVLVALAADYFVTPVLIHWLKPFGSFDNQSLEPTALT